MRGTLRMPEGRSYSNRNYSRRRAVPRHSPRQSRASRRNAAWQPAAVLLQHAGIDVEHDDPVEAEPAFATRKAMSPVPPATSRWRKLGFSGRLILAVKISFQIRWRPPDMRSFIRCNAKRPCEKRRPHAPACHAVAREKNRNAFFNHVSAMLGVWKPRVGGPRKWFCGWRTIAARRVSWLWTAPAR